MRDRFCEVNAMTEGRWRPTDPAASPDANQASRLVTIPENSVRHHDQSDAQGDQAFADGFSYPPAASRKSRGFPKIKGL
jgi:hypothetical protein